MLQLLKKHVFEKFERVLKPSNQKAKSQKDYLTDITIIKSLYTFTKEKQNLEILLKEKPNIAIDLVQQIIKLKQSENIFSMAEEKYNNLYLLEGELYYLL